MHAHGVVEARLILCARGDALKLHVIANPGRDPGIGGAPIPEIEGNDRVPRAGAGAGAGDSDDSDNEADPYLRGPDGANDDDSDHDGGDTRMRDCE